MKHIEITDLLQYLSGGMPEGEQIAVGTHLADCEACSEQLSSLVYIKENSGTVWEDLSAEEHGRTYRMWREVHALRIAAERSPALADKALRWLRNLGRSTELTLKALVDRGRKVASLAKGALPPGHGFELHPALSGVGSPEELNEVDKRLQKSSELLSQDQPESALSELLEAVKLDARSPQAAISQVCKNKTWVFQVVADSRRGRISIKAFGGKRKTAPAMALLICSQEEGCDLVAEFEPVEGESYTLAEFNELPSGTYRIAIEPV